MARALVENRRQAMADRPSDEIGHVYPIGDLREHVVDGGKCWCNPEYDEEGDMFVHNSMDGREKYETGELLPN